MNKNNKEHQIHKPRVGQNHVWFMEEIPKYKVQIPVVRSATIYLSTFTESKPNIAQLINDLSQLNSDDKINMIFNSPGGLVSEGRAIINTVLRTGADIQTELVSQAASMAALMFCIGSKRVIYENSSIMFHNFSGGTSGKGQEMLDHLNHTIENITLFFKSYIIGLSKKELNKMFNGREYWFGAEEMCRRGIATHVNIDGIMVPAKQYLKSLKKAKKKAKKRGIEIETIAEASLQGIDVMSPIVLAQNQSIDHVTEIISDAVTNNEFLYS